VIVRREKERERGGQNANLANVKVERLLATMNLEGGETALLPRLARARACVASASSWSLFLHVRTVIKLSAACSRFISHLAKPRQKHEPKSIDTDLPYPQYLRVARDT